MVARKDFENPEIEDVSLSVEQLQQILFLQSQVLGDAVGCDDSEILLSQLCTLAESYTPNAVATIMALDQNAGVLNVKSAPSLTPEACSRFDGLLPGDGSCGNAVFHNEPMYVSDTLKDERWRNIRGMARDFNICSCFAFPIRDAENRSIGSFAISSFEHRKPDGFHRMLLETCASIASVVLQREAAKKVREQIVTEQLNVRKLASLGVLAGGIAHDFNNLLGSILGYVDVSRISSTDKRTRDNLEWAIRGIDRARELTSQLLTFAKGGDPILQPHDVFEIVQEASDFALNGSNVDASIHCVNDPQVILAVDRVQMSQVIQNLLLNARQAMPDGGTIDITISEVEDALHVVNETSGFPDRTRSLKIDFLDHGCGIPAKLQDRIFDPYFSTKATGNGLGLALCHSIVKNHRGTIAVDSAPGEGTCFSIRIPIQNVDLPNSETEERITDTPHENGLVFVMDDDELIRGAMIGMLRQLGYSAIAFREGGELLRELPRYSAGDAVAFILDLTVVNGMGGLETAKRILELHPNARMVVTSGYSDDQVLSNYSAFGFSAALAKPFRSIELEKSLGALLRAV